MLNQKSKEIFHDLETSNKILTVVKELSQSSTLNEIFTKLSQILREHIKADRCSIFLFDKESNEIYSRIAEGVSLREIRMPSDCGIAGWSFSNKKTVRIKDAHKDKRFNKSIDAHTGYTTTSTLCIPILIANKKVIGVVNLLNKKNGSFTKEDEDQCVTILSYLSSIIQGFLTVEDMTVSRKKELDFLNVVNQVASEINLNSLLNKIIVNITKMLDAERSTLFINKEETGELFTEVGEGLGAQRLSFPNDKGIAGLVFTEAKSINIPHAYADLRFNPEFDQKTGFFTRSILCTPVLNKKGKVIGVTQVLNKRGGAFTAEDEARLAAFTSQIAIGIENANLFSNIKNVKNYNESILESMTNGIMTINPDNTIKTCNKSCHRILKLKKKDTTLKKINEIFTDKNSWLVEKIEKLYKNIEENKQQDWEDEKKELETTFMDTELVFDKLKISVNISILPLVNDEDEPLGTMILFEDISNEKRMKSTMSKYMSSDLAEKLMEGSDNALGGQEQIATVLFSDIRSFTSITEALGAKKTVSMLNEYFTLMVDCIQNEGGILDKFIGDAIMALFGTPFSHEDDPDRGVRAAIQMMVKLEELNEKRKKAGEFTLDHGMGVNTDTIVTGNIGSPKRMDYTVIGDGVNVAARLESANKKYGAHILISEFTFKALKSSYKYRLIDQVVVKGKKDPVGVYEILDYYTDATFPGLNEVVGHFNEGFEAYQKGNWQKAIAAFNKALKVNPNDVGSKLYVTRCEDLEKEEPKDWKGVWVWDSK